MIFQDLRRFWAKKGRTHGAKAEVILGQREGNDFIMERQPFFYCFTFSIWEADSVRSKVTDREANSEPMTFWAAASTSAAAT